MPFVYRLYIIILILQDVIILYEFLYDIMSVYLLNNFHMNTKEKDTLLCEPARHQGEFLPIAHSWAQP